MKRAYQKKCPFASQFDLQRDILCYVLYNKKKYFLVYHINLLKGGVTLKFKGESENVILKHRDPLVYEKSRNLLFEFVILVSY